MFAYRLLGRSLLDYFTTDDDSAGNKATIPTLDTLFFDVSFGELL